MSLDITTIPTRALARRTEECAQAKADFELQLEALLVGAPTVDLVRALARDAETSFSHYTEALIRLQEAK